MKYSVKHHPNYLLYHIKLRRESLIVIYTHLQFRINQREKIGYSTTVEEVGLIQIILLYFHCYKSKYRKALKAKKNAEEVPVEVQKAKSPPKSSQIRPSSNKAPLHRSTTQQSLSENPEKNIESKIKQNITIGGPKTRNKDSKIPRMSSVRNIH